MRLAWLMSALQRNLFWDGRRVPLEDEALDPLLKALAKARSDAHLLNEIEHARMRLCVR